MQIRDEFSQIFLFVPLSQTIELLLHRYQVRQIDAGGKVLALAAQNDCSDFGQGIQFIENGFQFPPHHGIQTIPVIRTIQVHPGHGVFHGDTDCLITIHMVLSLLENLSYFILMDPGMLVGPTNKALKLAFAMKGVPSFPVQIAF